MDSFINDMPDVLQAKHIREYLGISQTLAYNLMNSQGFPTLKINTRMIVSKQAFLAWLENSAGKQIIIRKAGATNE